MIESDAFIRHGKTTTANKNGFTLLFCRDNPCHIRFTISDSVDMVNDRRLNIASQDEVAVK
jgi:hypothetical protein